MKRNIVFSLCCYLLFSLLQPVNGYSAAAFGSGIDGVAPGKGGNTGEVTVKVMGHFKLPIDSVSLWAPDGTEIAGIIVNVIENGYAIDWEDESQGDIITVTFDLTGLATGNYDVSVVDDLGYSTYSFSRFTVVEGTESELWVNITGQTKVRFGAVTDYLIWYGNSGNPEELRSGVLFIAIPEELDYTLGFNPQDYTIPELVDTGGNPPEFDAYYGMDYRIIKLYIHDVPPSSLMPLKVTVLWGNTAVDHLLKVWWSGGKPDEYHPVWPVD